MPSLSATTGGGGGGPSEASALAATQNNTSAASPSSPQQQYYTAIGRSKEPAVVAAERYMTLMMHFEGVEAVMNGIDPSISFISPMVYYRGRPVVKSWITFEAKTLIPFQPYIRLRDIKSEDEMKSATVRWSVGGLHFTDHIHLSQLLQYQTISRTMKRVYKTLEDKLIAEEVLRLLTGPHFAAHCAPRQGAIDNAALVLPTLDYSHLRLRDYKQLLTVTPSHASSARPITDMNVVYHFMSEALVTAQLESEKRKEADEEKSRKTVAKAGGGQMVIRATNRDGEKKVLVIDKADFFRNNQSSRVEQLQDDEVTGIATKHDRPRYLCSCVRLRNNFFGAKDDEQFDADGKLIENGADGAEGNNGYNKANAAAIAAARLAGTGSSNGASSSSSSGKKPSAAEIAAAAASASELSTVLKLIVMNSFHFVTNVDLSSNKLTIIPDLSELPLVGLNLHDNRLASWDDLEQKLRPLQLLQNLTLFANPIQKEAVSVKEYKYSILSLFYVPSGLSIKAPPPRAGSGMGNSSSISSSSYHKVPKTLNISSNYYKAMATADKSGNLSIVNRSGGGNTSAQAAATVPATATGGGRPSMLPPIASGGGGGGVSPPGTANTTTGTRGNATFGGGASQVQQQHRSSYASTMGDSSSYGGGSGKKEAPQGIITLRSLDHCVVSPKEVDIVKTFIKTFETKRELTIKAERNPPKKQGSPTTAEANGGAAAAGSGKGAVAALRNGGGNGAAAARR